VVKEVISLSKTHTFFLHVSNLRTNRHSFLNLDATSFFEIVDIAFVQLSLLTHQLHSQLIFIRMLLQLRLKTIFPILELALRLCIRTPL
jgi:hypothetical protein